MSLPLFHCPGSLAFLDDDPDYLQMLALMLPDRWNVRLSARVGDCLAPLQAEPAFWEADAWNQQQLVDNCIYWPRSWLFLRTTPDWKRYRNG